MALVEKKNFEVYNSVYECMDDAHEFPNTNLVRLEKWFLRGKNKNKVLDYGFGYGENSIFLSSKGYNVFGTEISKNVISFLKKKLKKKNINNIKLLHINARMNKLPFKDNYFDSIVCLGVIQYLGTKQKTMNLIKEFQRCLKPKGKFIISTFGPQNTFIKKSVKINKNQYVFSGKEKFHNDINLKYKYYIPFNQKNFKSFFPKNMSVLEVGSWNNIYRGINGFHYVALGEKIGQK